MKIALTCSSISVMAYLGIGPGREIGEALAFLLALKRSEGEMERSEMEARLDIWWSERS